MESEKIVRLSTSRRFGVEIEVNSFDSRNFKLFPLDKINKELPKGIDEVAELVARSANEPVSIKTWHSTHNNTGWIVKPDSSCGMEICSPPKRGWIGIRSICQVIDAVARDRRIPVDETCSLHLHIDMADCDFEQIAAAIVWWIKCERVFLSAVPFQRKRNKYCQFIGLCDLFSHDSTLDPEIIIKRIGASKYYTINTFHLIRGDRKTLEFRIIGRDGCLNPFLTKNWIKLVLHFIDCSLQRGMPINCQRGNKWSSFLWLEPEDVFNFLHFDGTLSNGMRQTRDWFLASIIHNSREGELPGIWSSPITSYSKEQAERLGRKYGLDTMNLLQYLLPGSPELVYSGDYKD